jgi:hypothetical protein
MGRCDFYFNLSWITNNFFLFFSEIRKPGEIFLRPILKNLQKEGHLKLK